MASAIAPLISVPDAADALGLSPARVRLLAANGGLPAQKIGGRWLVERNGVEKRRARGSAGGRPFEPRNAWAVLGLASGDEVDGVGPVVRSRLRRALALESLGSLALRLERRAEVHRYSGHPGEISHVLADKRLVASGISAAHTLYEQAHAAGWGPPVVVPQGFAVFSADATVRRLVPAPAGAHWTEFGRGGHFPAMEAPHLLQRSPASPALDPAGARARL